MTATTAPASRRLRRTVGTAGTATVLLALAACTSTSSAATGATSGAGGKKNASISIALRTLPGVVDPDATGSEDINTIPSVSKSFAGTLFGFNGGHLSPDTAPQVVPPQPELALSADPSADGLQITVKLRSGVKSQAGNTLTATDVQWTVQRALHRQKTAATLLAQLNLDTADPVTVSDPTTAVFHLTAPTTAFRTIMSLPVLAIYDSKAVQQGGGAADPWGDTWLSTHTATFGAYELAALQLPTRIVLKANPDYWRGPSDVSQITFVGISDESTRLAAGLSGQVDWATAVDEGDVPKIRATKGVSLYSTKNVPLAYYAGFVSGNPETANPDLRRAISLAIDRKALVTAALNGLGSPVTTCLPASLQGPTTSLDVSPTAQVGAAKALLAKVPGSKNITLAYPSLAPHAAIVAQVLQSQLAAVGITITLKPYTSTPTFLADQAGAKFGLFISQFGPQIPTASYSFATMLSSTAAYRSTRFSDPAFDAAVVTAATSTDPAKRAAGLQQACQIVMEQTPVAMMFQSGTTSVAKSNLQVATSAGLPLAYNVTVS